jgi:hypothetical protein
MEPAQRRLIQRDDQVLGPDLGHGIPPPPAPPAARPAAFLLLRLKLSGPGNAPPTWK